MIVGILKKSLTSSRHVHRNNLFSWKNCWSKKNGNKRSSSNSSSRPSIPALRVARCSATASLSVCARTFWARRRCRRRPRGSPLPLPERVRSQSQAECRTSDRPAAPDRQLPTPPPGTRAPVPMLRKWQSKLRDNPLPHKRHLNVRHGTNNYIYNLIGIVWKLSLCFILQRK